MQIQRLLKNDELTQVDILSRLCVQCIQVSRLEGPGFPKIADTLLNKSEISEIVEMEVNRECTVCSSAPTDAVFILCNHAVMCQNCAELWIDENRSCPVCYFEVFSYDVGDFTSTFVGNSVY